MREVSAPASLVEKVGRLRQELQRERELTHGLGIALHASKINGTASGEARALEDAALLRHENDRLRVLLEEQAGEPSPRVETSQPSTDSSQRENLSPGANAKGDSPLPAAPVAASPGTPVFELTDKERETIFKARTGYEGDLVDIIKRILPELQEQRQRASALGEFIHTMRSLLGLKEGESLLHTVKAIMSRNGQLEGDFSTSRERVATWMKRCQYEAREVLAFHDQPCICLRCRQAKEHIDEARAALDKTKTP